MKARETRRYHHMHYFKRDREHPVYYRPLPRPNRRDYGVDGVELSAIVLAGLLLAFLCFGFADSLVAFVGR